jgi:hypothetical protein
MYASVLAYQFIEPVSFVKLKIPRVHAGAKGVSANMPATRKFVESEMMEKACPQI